MQRSKPSVMGLAALVLLLLVVSIVPAAAAGNVPTTSRPLSLIYTASSGGQPQGAIIAGQYVQLATPGCPVPARMLVDGVFIFKCPPSIKLPPLPRR